MAMIVPVLLAGGVGTRLWPLSREARPKQFLAPTGGDTLLEQTLGRLAHLNHLADPIIVGQDAHRFVIAEQMRLSGLAGRILLEPAARGTAPAVAAAALEARARFDESALLLVLPTDHAIADAAAFARAVNNAAATVESGDLALFGTVAERAETGYGYIRAGAALAEGVHRVAEFVEKPDAERAAAFVAAGDYFWNAGLFMFGAGDYLRALAEHAPAVAEAAAGAYDQAAPDIDFLRLAASAFAKSPSASIDRAVMEQTTAAVMVALDAGWNDLGSWSAVARALGSDERGNSARGDVWLADADDCVVHSDSRLVAALGVRDQIIVETADAVLVADRTREQAIKELVDDLKAHGRAEASTYQRVYRPWGSYEQIAAGPRFQVKHIRVKPGGQLSLQKHHHRAEHWVVVSGTARVTCDDAVSLLSENQSTYIPLGAVHRLENPGKLELDLIEVQSGGYLGEDDIVRFEDTYGRIGTSAAPSY